MNNSAVSNVPMFDLREQNQGLLRKSLEEAMQRVFDSGRYILGNEVDSLEKDLAEHCGAAAAVTCGSGTDALMLALASLDIGPGDEVIVPPFTFFATPASVCRLGARPVFVDIDPETYNLDPHQVENKINERTKAIIPVHMFGQCADMEPLWAAAERHDLTIIEDAAQAMGSEYQGKRTGTLGGLACFSFYPTKNLGAFGEGGMVVTNDQEWADKIAALRVHGSTRRYEHRYMGWNSRLDSIQAAILRAKLPWLDRWVDARISIASRYDALIDEYHLGHFARKPYVKNNLRHSFNQYVVRICDGRRDELREYLLAHGVGCDIYYPIPLHLQEAFAHLGYQEGDFSATEQACREVLALPMYPELSYVQQRRVIETCAEFLRGSLRMAA